MCGPCKKYINIGQPLLECEICFTAIHTKCYKTAGFSSATGSWTCTKCKDTVELRYNPYSSIDIDKNAFYDDEGAYDDLHIQQISRVLDSCKTITVKEKQAFKSAK